MNKGELIEQVAVATGLSKTDAGRAVDALFDAVHGSLVAGEEVRIAGFGAFSVAERAAREGRTPRTGGGGQDRRLEGADVQGRQGVEGRR